MKNKEWSKIYKHPSRLFNRNLINPTSGIIKIRNSIFSSIPLIEDKEFVLDRYRRCIDLILMNLYIVSKADAYLTIPMSNKFLFKGPVCDENIDVYSRWRCREILISMREIGLINIYKGFKAKPGFKSGRITVIVPTGLLKSKFGDYWSFDSGTFDKTPIRLRDDKKRLTQSKVITFEDRKLIRELENVVIQLNKLYKKTTLTCNIPISILDQRLGEKLGNLLTKYLIVNKLIILKDKIYNPNVYSMNNINEINQDIGINTNSHNIYKSIYLYIRNLGSNPGNYLKLFKKLGFSDSVNFLIKPRSMYRIFSHNYTGHGRFYGPTYQNIGKEFRKFIKINGEETIELDYNALHLRMLYHAMKIDFKGDPYATPSGQGRKYMKKIAFIVVNSDSRQQCIRAISYELNKFGKVSYEDSELLLDIFIKNNKPIAKTFYTKRWKSLSYTDSLIMNNILVELMNQDIVGFPIHDSVIVKKKHEEILRQIMVDKYKDQFGFDPII